jgi:hypothetical protein
MKKLAAAFLLIFCFSPFAYADSASDWAKLPEARKAQIRDNYRKYQALSPAEKMQLQKNYEEYKSLPPDEQKRIQDNVEEIKKLPPAELADLKTAAGRFKQLSPEDRQEKLNEIRQQLRNAAKRRKHLKQSH